MNDQTRYWRIIRFQFFTVLIIMKSYILKFFMKFFMNSLVFDFVRFSKMFRLKKGV